MLVALQVSSVPRQLGRYEILERIGQGGMAEVYRGRTTGPDGKPHLVAIKRLSEELSRDPGVVSMFLDEARLAAQLSHPSIVHLEEFGADDSGRAYMVLEFIDGRDLRWCLAMAAQARFWLPVEFSLSVVRQLCRALAYAHDARAADGQPLAIVHRDVSHSNIFLSRRGEVKLADFGIARARGRQSRTRTGMVKGKLGYLSPEQVRAEPLDGRTDIFAATVVLWELLTQRRMFVGASEFKTMLAVCTGGRTPPSAFRPGLPQAIDSLVLKGVAIEREARFSSAAEMGAAIDQISAEVGLDLGPAIISEVIRYLSEVEAAQPKTPIAEALERSDHTPTEILESFGRVPTPTDPTGDDLTETSEPSNAFAQAAEPDRLQTMEHDPWSGEHSAIDLVHPTTSGVFPSGGISLTPYVRRVATSVSMFGENQILLRRGGAPRSLASFSELLLALGPSVRTPHDALSVDGKNWMSAERFAILTEMEFGAALEEPADPHTWTPSTSAELVGLIGDLGLRGFTGRVLVARGEDRRACLLERGGLVGVVSRQPAEQMITAIVADAAPKDPRAVQRLLQEVISKGVTLEQAAMDLLHLSPDLISDVRAGLAIETLASMIRLEDKQTAREPSGGWPSRSSVAGSQLELLLPASALAWTDESLEAAIQPLRGATMVIMSVLPPLAQLLHLRESARPILKALQPGRTISQFLANFQAGEQLRLAKRLLLIFAATGAIRLR